MTKALLINTASRPRRRRQRQGRHDRRRPERGPGLGEGQPGGGVRLHAARASTTSARDVLDARPGRPLGPRLHGPGREQAGQGDAGVDRPARADRRQRVRQRPRPRGRAPAGAPTGATSSAAPARAPAAAPTRATTSRASTSRPARPGRFAVTVRGTAIGGDGVPGNANPTDQDFALVVSNAAEQAGAGAGAPGDHGSTTSPAATATARSSPTSRWSSPSRSATPAPIRRPGLSAATLDRLGGLAVTQGSSAIPTIAADGVRGRTRPALLRASRQRGHLRRRRGRDPDDRHGRRDADGPAGDADRRARAPLQTYTAHQVPLAIPDDSAAGVSSSVFVAERGRIKDLNVTIPAHRHSWVGDLASTSSGPTGRPCAWPTTPAARTTAATTSPARPSTTRRRRTSPRGRRPTRATSGRRTTSCRASTARAGAAPGRCACATCSRATPARCTAGAWGPRRRSATSTRRRPTRRSPRPGEPDQLDDRRSSRSASNDAGATFECRLDGAAFAPCAATMSFSGLALGSHTVQRAGDRRLRQRGRDAGVVQLVDRARRRRRPRPRRRPASCWPPRGAAGRRAGRALRRAGGVRVGVPGERDAERVGRAPRGGWSWGARPCRSGAASKRRGSAGTAELSRAPDPEGALALRRRASSPRRR